MKRRTQDLTGEKFGAWTVKGILPDGRYECRCECGNTGAVHGYSLTHERSKSCVACGSKRSTLSRTKHGQTATPAYREWLRMKTRCYNEESVDYRRHGRLGVRVCERWRKSFQNFIKDVGIPECDSSLVRINWAGDYAPGNVQWLPRDEARMVYNNRGK